MKSCRFVKTLCLLVLFVGVFVMPLHAAEAPRIALLPLADVSLGTHGIDGVNLSVTQNFRDALQSRGLDLVPDADVMQFMVMNRVRFAGYLNEFLAKKIGIELECSHVLVGTVTEFQKGSEATFGMTLTMFDTRTGIPVWGGSQGKSSEELIAALGLGGTKRIEDLQRLTFDELLSGVASNFDAPVLVAAVKPYEVVDLQLSSQYSRGDEDINCQLEMNYLTPPRRVALKSGRHEYPLVESETLGVYDGILRTESHDGVYDLDLIIDWGEQGGSEIVGGLASYQVFNSEPELNLKLNHSVLVADITLFRSDLVIVPSLEGGHLLDRWMVQIRNEQGQKLWLEEHVGRLPERLVWDGRDQKGKQMQDGLYTIALKAWDVVGNEVTKSFPVYLQSEVASVDIDVFYKDGKKYLEIRPVADISAPFVSWELVASNVRGQQFFQQFGRDLPAIIEIPERVGDDTVICDLQAKDLLGNHLQLKNARVDVSLAKAKSASPEFATASEPEWLDNF